MTRITWRRNGQWGITNVSLGQLPPTLYNAVAKLKALEDFVDELVEMAYPERDGDDVMSIDMLRSRLINNQDELMLYRDALCEEGQECR